MCCFLWLHGGNESPLMSHVPRPCGFTENGCNLGILPLTLDYWMFYFSFLLLSLTNNHNDQVLSKGVLALSICIFPSDPSQWQLAHLNAGRTTFEDPPTLTVHKSVIALLVSMMTHFICISSNHEARWKQKVCFTTASFSVSFCVRVSVPSYMQIHLNGDVNVTQ